MGGWGGGGIREVSRCQDVSVSVSYCVCVCRGGGGGGLLER